MKSDSIKNGIPKSLISVFIFVSLSVILAGIFFYKSLERKITTEEQNELAAIINLKVREIEKWRMEHLRDAKFIHKNSILKEHITEFIYGRNDAHRGKILEWMEIYIRDYDYSGIHLFDSSGNHRLSWPEGLVINDSLLNKELKKRNDNLPRFLDFHLANNGSSIYIDLLIPMALDHGRCTMVLRIEPGEVLYPLVQEWPIPGKSSETLLLRRDGDSVLYLNNLKHQQNTALKFRLPLSNLNLPATVAVTGYEGPFEGSDYRGIPVLSQLRRIPDSPWYMVAKVDKAEIYAPLKGQIALISIIVGLIILATAISVFSLWRNQRMVFLEELNSVKDRFFTIISHDLKNPFVSIIGFAELLREKIKNNDLEKAAEYSEIITKSSYRSVDLLNDLIEWSRLQTGKSKYFPVKMDLVSVIKTEVELLNPSALQKSIELTGKMPDQCFINADRGMISSAIRNMVSNSIKFTRPGGKIHIFVLIDNSEVMVEISDTGIGIRPEILDSIFKAGAVVTTKGTNNEEGTGFGLILCNEFIRRHGGTISVKSEPGAGSSFTIRLPMDSGK